MRITDLRVTGLVCAIALASTGLLFSLAPAGWPGESNGCRIESRPQCFCERLRDGPIAQPANTVSNLGFVLAGLAIALWRDRERPRRARPAGGARTGRAARTNPMTSGDFRPAVYATVTALLGPGSMALHASMTRWGGSVDLASMYLYIALVGVLGLGRLLDLSTRSLAAIYLPACALLIASKIWTPLDPNVVFGLLVGGMAAIEFVTWRRRPELHMDRRPFVAAMLLFGIAFAIWVPSLSGGPLCDPDSFAQGHAIWHLLCAGATIALYVYQRSEDAGYSTPTPPNPQ